MSKREPQSRRTWNLVSTFVSWSSGSRHQAAAAPIIRSHRQLGGPAEVCGPSAENCADTRGHTQLRLDSHDFQGSRPPTKIKATEPCCKLLPGRVPLTINNK